MTTRNDPCILQDLHPPADDMRGEVLDHLRRDPPALPCKYFYDAEGSRLFDRICELDEYYVTRTELGILEDWSHEMADRMGERVLLIEPGSGSSTKTRTILRALRDCAGYLPIDIAREHLREAAVRIGRRFPDLPVWPVCADFTEDFTLPEIASRAKQRFVFFPGSTIGNFDRRGQRVLLRRMLEMCRPEGGGLLIGIDLIKDVHRLEAAYNDAQGVTAAFNLNLLARLNRELGADFELDRFDHRAVYDRSEQRIEMQLVSKADQVVSIDGERFAFRRDESICTEHSHKFDVDDFAGLAREVGFGLDSVWSDEEELFGVLLLKTR